MADAPVVIVAYDDAWPAMFEAERAALERLLAPWLAGRIEHVGSTAVPGLAAKPVIDIMAPVADLASSRPAIAAAERAGWCHAPYRDDVMHWFCKPSPALRTHHLHLVPGASALWHERIAFRDALRRDRALADEYAALKRMLAAQHTDDRDGYTEGKGAFIRRVLSRPR